MIIKPFYDRLSKLTETKRFLTRKIKQYEKRLIQIDKEIAIIKNEVYD